MNTPPNNIRDKAKRSGFRLPTVIVFMLLSTAFGVLSAMNPLGIVGVLLSALAAALMTDMALAFRDKYAYVPMVFCTGVLSYLIAAYLWRMTGIESSGRMLILAIPAFFPTILALPIYLTVKAKSSRAVSVMASAVCGSLLWVLYTALAVRGVYGNLSADTVRLAIDTFFTPVRESLSSFSYDFAGTNVSYYSESELDTMITTMKSLLPSILLAGMILVSYLVTVAAKIIFSCFDIDGLFPVSYRIRPFAERTDDGESKLTMRCETVVWRMEFDSISAGLFISAYLLTVLFGIENQIGIAAANLTVILFPGFVYAGLRDIFSPISFGANGAVVGGRGCLTLILCIIAFIIQPLLCGVVLAIAGVLSVFRENRLRKLNEHKNQSDADNDSHNNEPKDD